MKRLSPVLTDYRITVIPPNTLLDFDAASVAIGNDDLPHWTIPVRALCVINEGDELFADYRLALPDFVPDKSWLP